MNATGTIEASRLFDLTGRVAVVTGASRGIGLSAALGLAQAGANVVISARDQRALRRAADTINKTGARALPVPADVSNRDQVKALVERALAEFKRIDVLVNCAGVIVRKPSLEVTNEDWSRVISTNLDGTFLCCQEVGGHMVDSRRGGKIINVASLASTIGLPDRIAYAASKGGVVSLTRTLAVEWAKYHINVNAVAPGWIRTELTRKLHQDSRTSKGLVRRIPAGRWGEPEDLQGAFIFLASHASDYITGQVIWVDGGWTAA